ncbi:MAG: xanthine dehydrogenase accessory protein XdhC [Aestuariivirga sp.]|uniref:xanthine dehydrogenase accessory protein XdhC n=1 Tax=Aestuariivirga sp. TaxID=2650926 RepID=UPI0025C543B4|nr:xanthine dehydrogenase accessory protein XdhC [Aestuariivirga sp.]MCA3562294.1 xanthine dehydrogenase accessory protein XdhC [Aestuariivirga sp.]
MKVWSLIARLLETEGTCALVSVTRAEGSVPREEGARMVVTAHGFHGTIGGGTLEWKALAQAQRLLGSPRQVKMLTLSLGPDLGQCCGGRVTLAIESFDAAALPEARTLAAREAEGSFTLNNRLPGVTEIFGERRRAVLVFGAGHVGRALILSLASLPFDVTWVDPRPEAFPGAMPQNVTCFSGDPLEAVAAAPEGALAFIMSHSHALDLQIADAALRNMAIARVGVIGSATKRARFERRLTQAGVDKSRVAAMICPIGIGGIRSKLPAAIAVAVAAQLITLDEALSASATHGILPARNAG